MAETTNSDENGVPRGRSPSFPFVPLKTAVGRIEELEAMFGRHPVPVLKAGTAWKMKGASSQAAQTLAALKAFGFLQYEGRKDGRKALLTDDARTYLRAQQENIKRAILRKAALKPKEIAKYWAEWKADPPPDEIRLDELGLEANYTKDGAKAFLKVYDDTIAYAELSKSDKMAPEDGEGSVGIAPEADSADDIKRADTPLRSQRPRVQRQEGTSMKEDVFTLNEGDAVLQWPSTLSSESYADLKDWLSLMLRKIERQAHADDENAEPAND